jgi:hypothetical protein
MNNRLSLFILILLGLPACYEPVEGCLDPVAVNYEVGADKDCCCEYPNLVLRVEHTLYDSLTFRFGDTLNLNGQPLIFTRFQFLLSGIRLWRGGAAQSIDETVEFSAFGDGGGIETAVLPDDFLLASRNTNTYTVGSFTYPGNYDSLSLNLGLQPPARFAIPGSFPDEHPLSLTPDSMYVSGNYVMNSLEFVRFLPQADTVRLTIFEPLTLSLGAGTQSSIKVLTGFDASVPIRICYDCWLKDVNFVGTEQEMIDQILKNTPNAFSLQE